jgi:hypothetical protein
MIMTITSKQEKFLNKIIPIPSLKLGTVIKELQTGIVASTGVDTDVIVRSGSGEVLIGQGAGSDVDWKAISGDATLSNTGAFALVGNDHSTPGIGKLPKLAIGEYDTADAVEAVAASATDINADTDVVTVTAHGFSTGDCVNVATSDTLPTGISANTAYYVRKGTDNTFTLYDTRAHAVAGGATGLVNITAVGTGDQTFTSVTAIGQHYLGVTLPDNALVIGGGVEVLTTFTDGADDSMTLALSIKDANDLVTATAVSAEGNRWDAGNHDIVPDNTGSSAIKLAAASELLVTVGDDQPSAGKMRVWLLYIEGI